MYRYLQSEFYRLLRYKWAYWFIGICSLLLLSANIVLAAVKQSDSSFQYATTRFSFAYIYSSMIAVFLLSIMVSVIAFGNEYNNHTLKNCVSYGISRGTVYLGKLFVQIAYALTAFVTILGIYVASGYLLLENSGPQELNLLLLTSLACLPLFIFVVAATNCFAFIIESTGGAIAAVIGVIAAFPIVSNNLGMRFEFFAQLSKILPWNMINSIGFNAENYTLQFTWAAETAYRNYWLLGILHTVLVSFIGYILFRKKEVK